MSWIETYSGRKIDLLNPDPNEFTLEDIFHALVNVPRFGGHTKEFYSVGNHSYNVSKLVPYRLKFQAIMHDATEAFIGDMPTPFKHLLPDYRAAEGRLWRAIAHKFKLPYELDPLVKVADKTALIHERDYLKPECNFVWEGYDDVMVLPPGTFNWQKVNKEALVKVAREYEELQ